MGSVSVIALIVLMECVFTFEAPAGTRIQARFEKLMMGIQRFNFFQARQADNNLCFNGAIRLYDVDVGGEMPLLEEACRTSPMFPERTSSLNSLVITSTSGDSEFDFRVQVIQPANKEEANDFENDNANEGMQEEENENEYQDSVYPNSNTDNSEVKITSLKPPNNPPTESTVNSTTEEVSTNLSLPRPPNIQSQLQPAPIVQSPVNKEVEEKNGNLEMENDNVLSIPPLESEVVDNMSMEESDIIETSSVTMSSTEFELMEEELEETTTESPTSTTLMEIEHLKSLNNTTENIVIVTPSKIDSLDDEDDSESVSSGVGEEEENSNELRNNDMENEFAASLITKRDRPSSHNKPPLSKSVDSSEDQERTLKYHLAIGKSQKNLKDSLLDKIPLAFFRKAQEIYI